MNAYLTADNQMNYNTRVLNRISKTITIRLNYFNQSGSNHRCTIQLDPSFPSTSVLLDTYRWTTKYHPNVDTHLYCLA